MRRRWLLPAIAAPAAVAVWSGWVGLGGLCGFGVVRLLPGIADSVELNTAITLPIGVEAYAAYALWAWIASGANERARRFAAWSALGALAYGMAGQVIYHLLAAAGVARAPWPVTVTVSCMPVVVLGFAAALTHLMHEPAEADDTGETVHEAEAQTEAGTGAGAPAGTVSPDVIEAAKTRLRSALTQHFRLSDNELRAQFRLSRGEVSRVREDVTAELAELAELAAANGRPDREQEYSP